MNVSVMVFTRDLRLADNPALAAAARAPAMVPLFVLDEAILRRASAHANRLGFLLDSLRDLDSGLRNAGGALVLRAGPWAETVLERRHRRRARAASTSPTTSRATPPPGSGSWNSGRRGARVTVVRHPGTHRGRARRRPRAGRRAIPGLHALLPAVAGRSLAAPGRPPRPGSRCPRASALRPASPAG